MEWFALSLKNYHLLLYRNITSNVNGSWMQKFRSSFIFLFYLGFHSQVPSRHLPAQRAAIETLEKGVKYVQN